MNFTLVLENAFKSNQNPENAFAMAKYMKTIFRFFWYKTEERRRILKFERKQSSRFSKRKENLLDLYSKSEREFQYCAIEILIKELKGIIKKKTFN
jgi:3-methyladenine DNA glycosylase AlkD